MAVQTIDDVEDALKSREVSVRTLYSAWERRRPVPEDRASKAHAPTEAAGPQIDWLRDHSLAERFTERAVEKEEFLLVCDAAREIIRLHGSDREDVRTTLVRVTMNYALALERLGFTDEARRELEPCVSPAFRPLLGRALKRDALLQLAEILNEAAVRAGDRATRMQATADALSFATKALETDPASLDALISVAATSLVLAQRDEAAQAEAQRRAQQVLEVVDKLEDTEGPRFLSTRARAEAHVILGQLDKAADAYGQLRSFSPMSIPALAKARHRARVLAEASDQPRTFFDKAFPPLQLIVFSGHLPDRPGEQGRFPLDRVDAAREMVNRKLDEMGAHVGLLSASAGADLLLVDALLARNGIVHLILPWSQDEFRRTSIDPFEPAGQPPLWGPAFDNAISKAATLREIGQLYQPGSSAGWEYMAEVTAGLALQTARASRLDVQPVALWDGLPGRGPGGTAWFVNFWRDQLRHDVKVVDLPRPAATSSSPGHRSRATRSERSILNLEVKSMLFADIVGYSRLTENVIPEFVTRFLDRVSQLAATSRHAPISLNTWGDAVYAVFDFASDAGSFALELTQMIHDRRDEWLRSGLYWEDWAGSGAEPVKHPLNIRIGLHTGPVFVHYDPVVRRLSFTGAHVNRAARIEPVTKPGEVYASEEFAALVELSAEIQRHADGTAGYDAPGFVCAYAGSMPLAKGYPGRYRIHRLIPVRRMDIEELAKAAHILYCEEAKKRGERPEDNAALRSWDELADDLRDANRAQVADIPVKLRMLGYAIASGRGLSPSAMQLSNDRVERAAMYEHERWMNERRRNGWVWAPVRDNARKHHPLIVEWDQLPEVEKDKDRAVVRSVPRLLETAGFSVRPLSEEA